MPHCRKIRRTGKREGGFWKSAGKELKDNSFLQQLVDSFAAQTAGEFKNMTQTTGFKVMSGYEGIENAYRRELDKAVIKICSGTFSQDKVVRDVVHDLAQSGLRSIDFASGYSMQLDTAARLAIRTGCHQLAGKVQDKNIEQTGENLVYVSKHWGARNTGTGHANHEQWQGRVYFIQCKTAPYCPRKSRPIQCRTFPLAPHIDENGMFHMIMNYKLRR